MAKPGRKPKEPDPPDLSAPLGRDHNGNPISKGVPAMIYLHGRAAVARVIGVNGFELVRQENESEDEFKLRALQTGAAKGLRWLAFERPAIVDRGAR